MSSRIPKPLFRSHLPVCLALINSKTCRNFKDNISTGGCISIQTFNLIVPYELIHIIVVSTGPRVSNNKGRKSGKLTRGKVGDKNRQQDANKYCSCSTKLCNCCREFNIPVVALQGPGCASLQYLKGDRLAISMSFGERVLTNTTISSE